MKTTALITSAYVAFLFALLLALPWLFKFFGWYFDWVKAL